MMIDISGVQGPVVDVVSTFRAPREKVFRTWTDAALIPKWFMAAPGYLPALADVDLKSLGGWKITVRPGDDRGESVIEGNFIHIVPGLELAYSWTGNIPGGEYYTLVNARFEDVDGGGSLVRLTHGVFRSAGDQEAHAMGWRLCFSGLAQALGEDVESP